MQPAATPHQVRTAAAAALADAEGLAVNEILEAIDAIGDAAYELDSKKAEVMIAALEEVFGRTLPGPADLCREQFNSFAALVELVVGVVVEEPAWVSS